MKFNLDYNLRNNSTSAVHYNINTFLLKHGSMSLYIFDKWHVNKLIVVLYSPDIDEKYFLQF